MSYQERREQEQRELKAIQEAFKQELEQQLAWMRSLPEEALAPRDARFLQDESERNHGVEWFIQAYLSNAMQLQRYQESDTGVHDFVQDRIDGYWTTSYREKVMIVAAANALAQQKGQSGDEIYQQEFTVKRKAFQVMQWIVGGIVALPLAALFTALALLSVVVTRSSGCAGPLFKALGCVICGIGYGAGYLTGKPRKKPQSFDRIFKSAPVSKREPRVSGFNEVDWRARKDAGYQPLPDGASMA
jgi:hypothetical protein